MVVVVVVCVCVEGKPARIRPGEGEGVWSRAALLAPSDHGALRDLHGGLARRSRRG